MHLEGHGGSQSSPSFCNVLFFVGVRFEDTANLVTCCLLVLLWCLLPLLGCCPIHVVSMFKSPSIACRQGFFYVLSIASKKTCTRRICLASAFRRAFSQRGPLHQALSVNLLVPFGQTEPFDRGTSSCLPSQEYEKRFESIHSFAPELSPKTRRSGVESSMCVVWRA